MRNFHKIFVQELHTACYENSIKTAIMGDHENLPSFSKNDIDLFVSDVKVTDRLIQKICAFHNYSIIVRNRNQTGANYRILSNSINFDELSQMNCQTARILYLKRHIIKLDIFSSIKYLSIFTLISKDDLLKNIAYDNEFPVGDPLLEAISTNVYSLLKLGIIKYDKDWFSKTAGLPQSVNLNIFNNFFSQCDINITDMKQARRRLLKKVIWQNLKLPHLLLYNFYMNAFFTIRRIITKHTGCILIILGTDRVGKSTLLEHYWELCDFLFIKKSSRRLYWRPMYLPRISSLLKKKKYYSEDSKVSFKSRFSVFKLLYYSIDYAIGILVHKLTTARSGIVIYDRYIPDMLVFPERFMISRNSIWLIKLMNRLLIPKNSRVVVLTAPIELLRQRGLEHTHEETYRQLVEYEELSKKFNFFKINVCDKSCKDNGLSQFIRISIQERMQF